MDKLMLGFSTTIIGMLVVFVGLIILILCIYGMTCLTRQRASAPKAEAPAPAPAPAQPAEESLPQAEEQSDEQLIAVITAAIAAVWQKEESGFVVRRVRRCQSSTARARAARDEQIYSRL